MAVDDQFGFRSLPYVSPQVTVTRQADGTVYLRSPVAPAVPPRSIAHLFAQRAIEKPDHPLVLRRNDAGNWAGASYSEAFARASGVAAWLLSGEVNVGGGVMILSENSVEHAMVMLGCYLSGVPLTALSHSYGLSSDLSKLRHCFELIKPGVVFVQSSQRYARACAELRSLAGHVRIISAEGDGDADISLADIEARSAPDRVAEALAKIGPDTLAKYLFTSGSSGLPKAVPQTHRMMTAMLAARQGLLQDPREILPPTTIDWMPWSHMSAGNIAFNQNLWAGGTFHIDDGRPVAGKFQETLRNFVELSPVAFVSAPIAFEMLANALEEDESMAEPFFRNMRWMAYGGAALSQEVADRIENIAERAIGMRLPISTTYGATETHGVTMVYWNTDRVGQLGLPMPGVSIKLAPFNGKLEVRVKGDGVASSYLGDPQRTQAAFDAEGFYCTGDAARMIDHDTPEQGLAFDGRVTEDFKLSSGTWVSVGMLRHELVACCSPYITDLVLVGQDKPYLSALVWLSPKASDNPTAAAEAIVDRLNAFNARAGGSSRQIRRIRLLSEAPSLADGEITEKGYVNQRAVVVRRAADIANIYAEPVCRDVLVVGRR